MEILTIILICVLAGTGLLLLFKILKWGFQKKTSIATMFFLLIGIIASITIYPQFFVKMEFIQSKVYPNLFLIKNPIKDKSTIYKAIKEKVHQEIKNASKYKKLRFYEYSKGDWGENGTAYFINHKEKPDGMTAELLEYYPEYLLAEFILQPCRKDSPNNLGVLDYYNATKRTKTDTLFNSCKKEHSVFIKDTSQYSPRFLKRIEKSNSYLLGKIIKNCNGNLGNITLDNFPTLIEK